MLLRILKKRGDFFKKIFFAGTGLFLYMLSYASAAIVPERNIVSEPIQHLLRELSENRKARRAASLL